MVRTYEEAIEDQPLNFRLWSMLCARGTFLTETSRAPSVSVSREYKTPLTVPRRYLVLSNVYAAVGRYHDSMLTFLGLYRPHSFQRRKNLRAALDCRKSLRSNDELLGIKLLERQLTTVCWSNWIFTCIPISQL